LFPAAVAAETALEEKDWPFDSFWNKVVARVLSLPYNSTGLKLSCSRQQHVVIIAAPKKMRQPNCKSSNDSGVAADDEALVLGYDRT